MLYTIARFWENIREIWKQMLRSQSCSTLVVVLFYGFPLQGFLPLDFKIWNMKSILLLESRRHISSKESEMWIIQGTLPWCSPPVRTEVWNQASPQKDRWNNLVRSNVIQLSIHLWDTVNCIFFVLVDLRRNLIVGWDFTFEPYRTSFCLIQQRPKTRVSLEEMENLAPAN